MNDINEDFTVRLNQTGINDSINSIDELPPLVQKEGAPEKLINRAAKNNIQEVQVEVEDPEIKNEKPASRCAFLSCNKLVEKANTHKVKFAFLENFNGKFSFSSWRSKLISGIMILILVGYFVYKSFSLGTLDSIQAIQVF